MADQRAPESDSVTAQEVPTATATTSSSSSSLLPAASPAVSTIRSSSTTRFSEENDKLWSAVRQLRVPAAPFQRVLEVDLSPLADTLANHFKNFLLAELKLSCGWKIVPHGGIANDTASSGAAVEAYLILQLKHTEGEVHATFDGESLTFEVTGSAGATLPIPMGSVRMTALWVRFCRGINEFAKQYEATLSITKGPNGELVDFGGDSGPMACKLIIQQTPVSLSVAVDGSAEDVLLLQKPNPSDTRNAIQQFPTLTRSEVAWLPEKGKLLICALSFLYRARSGVEPPPGVLERVVVTVFKEKNWHRTISEIEAAQITFVEALTLTLKMLCSNDLDMKMKVLARELLASNEEQLWRMFPAPTGQTTDMSTPALQEPAGANVPTSATMEAPAKPSAPSIASLTSPIPRPEDCWYYVLVEREETEFVVQQMYGPSYTQTGWESAALAVGRPSASPFIVAHFDHLPRENRLENEFLIDQILLLEGPTPRVLVLWYRNSINFVIGRVPSSRHTLVVAFGDVHQTVLDYWASLFYSRPIEATSPVVKANFASSLVRKVQRNAVFLVSQFNPAGDEVEVNASELKFRQSLVPLHIMWSPL